MCTTGPSPTVLVFITSDGKQDQKTIGYVNNHTFTEQANSSVNLYAPHVFKATVRGDRV